ncbi:MAG: GntR family transcriptional regulator, partial [Clostridia bacterium]|nr:GntR family transcriptional regulator [Clostridia bacterium]
MIEHKSISLAEQVFDRLETDILSGKYQPGEVLTELKLVNDLGVSRTPIREALRRLEQEHIIEITPKGILVLGVSQKDLEDILEIRTRIEGLAA